MFSTWRFNLGYLNDLSELNYLPVGGDVKKAKLLKEEGNAFVKKGQHEKAVEKYTQSLSQDPTEITTYTNR